MGWSTFAIIAVIVWGVVTIWTRRHDRELGVTRDEDGNPVFAPQAKVDTSAQDSEIAELKDRIAVLERIATDNNSADARERTRIASEIEALRGSESGPGATALPPAPPPAQAKDTSPPASTDA